MNNEQTPASDNQMVVVAAAFRALGNGTMTEVIYAAELDKNTSWHTSRSFTRAICNLETMGLLRNVGRRKCEITGRLARVLAWNPEGDDHVVRPVHVELTDDDVEVLRTNPGAIAGRIVAEAERQRANHARLRARREHVLTALIVTEGRAQAVRAMDASALSDSI